MRVVHVLRKPLSEGTVASNTLKHGCGGLNIGSSRIGGSGGTTRSGQTPYPLKEDGTEDRSVSWARTGHEIVATGEGRWPANLILQHLDGCRCAGTKRVKGSELNPRCSSESVGGIYSPMGTVHKRGHTDEDGKETIANWICVEGCPVKALDEQTGVVSYGDTGGASRFFKQIGGSSG